MQCNSNDTLGIIDISTLYDTYLPALQLKLQEEEIVCNLFGWSHILVHSETMFTHLLPGVASVVMSYQC